MDTLREGLAGAGPTRPRLRSISESVGPVFKDAGLTITAWRWLPTDDEIYGSLYGPQALAARMFGRIDPHWYLGGGSE